MFKMSDYLDLSSQNSTHFGSSNKTKDGLVADYV